MFARLRREHGVRSYLAHTMTVTPANLDQVAEVIRHCRTMGFRMFAFQPAAYVGHEDRWDAQYDDVTIEAVWDEIEAGAGTRLPHRVVEFGDTRCNRVSWGAYVGDRYVPVFDDRQPATTGPTTCSSKPFPTTFSSPRAPSSPPASCGPPCDDPGSRPSPPPGRTASCAAPAASARCVGASAR